MSHCKDCNAAKARRYRRNNRARLRELNKRYDATRWAAYLKRTYGITVADYGRLLREQDGLCAICGKSESGGRTTRMHVDHDHETGKVRGLLCSKCNQMIGYGNDNPEILEAAALYLRANTEVAKAFIEAYMNS